MRDPLFRLPWLQACSFFLCSALGSSSASAMQSASVLEQVASLPVQGQPELPRLDYLIAAEGFQAVLGRNAAGDELILDNGLIRRTWRVSPNAACVGFDNLMSGQALLRSVRPEARVSLDGVAYDVGGLLGQPNHAYLKPEWLQAMRSDPKAMQLVAIEAGEPVERLAWGRRRHAAPDASWPPKGVRLRMDYALPAGAFEGSEAVRVSVHYELYDGLPAMGKWIQVHNGGERTLRLDRFTGEELALVEEGNWVEHRDGVALPRPGGLHVETDFAFGGFNSPNATRHAVHWRPDPLYSSQVNWERKSPCLLVCEPTYGPAQDIAAGASFEGFGVFELVYGDTDRERRGLALRRMYRTLAPWVTENPITHHLLSHDAGRVRQAIDQAKAVGFEAIILSFGSGFNMENQDPAFLAEWKAVADYAEAAGIELGSYSLFSSRGVGSENMIVSPEGQRPTHGQCPAVTSAWGQAWLASIRSFYAQTGFDQFENDGPYPGDVDISARPPFQQGLEDSRWVQWSMTRDLYRELRAKGVYINAPDYYYMSGSNKCGMGYREVNWSLPRAEQVLHTRQNIYDGTWTKTPSMGWMFVPLSEYQGGGAAATIEPLHEHLDHYERMLRSNLGMGVQAHYRGPQLFDGEPTREMLASVVAWFKRYRDILESDILHGRRADGRGLDWVLHVNPKLEIKGMLCVYNPLPQRVTQTLRPSLYYTGLSELAQVSIGEGAAQSYALARDYSIEIEVEVPAGGMQWVVIR